MRLKEISINEFTALLRWKAVKGKRKFTLYIPPHLIPPLRPFKTHEIKDEVTGVVYVVFIRLGEQGWLVRVRIREQPFNTIGEALKQASSK